MSLHKCSVDEYNNYTPFLVCCSFSIFAISISKVCDAWLTKCEDVPDKTCVACLT